METMKDINALILYFASIIFLSIFLVGFFPMDAKKNTNESKKTYLQVSNNTVEKLVILVIDALRVDFVDHTKSNFMPYLQKLVKDGESCFITTRTAAPTVTMPRIKALTSGTIPNYMDIVMNFGSTEFQQDTFIRQSIKRGLRTIFYGDDTWLKMFPNSFIRSQGVHSFFASDFWEVDKNITTQLKQELNKTDWDILILHYLGLDHIGHMEGPSSKHIATKLREMDDVVHLIDQTLNHQNKNNNMILLTSDHGMKDSGGHGGVTFAEVNVPLISIGRPCNHIPGWPDVHEYSPLQTDIASTLSALLGLPTPAENTGKVIPALLNNISHRDILLRLKQDAEKIAQIYRMDEHYREAIQEASYLFDRAMLNRSEEAMRTAIAEYFRLLTVLGTDIEKTRTEFNLSLLTIGCIGLTFCLIIALSTFYHNFPTNWLAACIAVGTVCHTFSLAASSFIEEEHQTWYFLWATLLVLCFRKKLQKDSSISNIVSMIFLLLMHRFARKLNQTGDKWAHIPDIHDYLRENPLYHGSIFFIGVSLLYWIFSSKHHSTIGRIFYALALMSIPSYHMAVNSFDLKIIIYPQSRGRTEVNVFFVLLVTFVVRSYVTRVNSSWSWALLALLLCRPHNAILVPMQIIISGFLHELLPEDPAWNSIAHTWTGCLFYFYQGNSNSIANIDVAAGFIGAEDYNPWYASFLTVCNTYSAHILAYLLTTPATTSVLLIKLLPITFYCILLFQQRHHLFVWSVFSPKLLIISAEYCVIFIVVCTRFFIKYIK